ncbi:MAG: DDE-type integrase/transposase/recombinase [bacterium]|jgi:putative transposase|nr:DDE-type integrase/transposase/recombinase [bacterium]MDD4153401.1 DDE-type integrase/transposase/recombinase [bacterium]MDD4558893.1 DDE-type integrase/transposase/recombinase [bacterium]
MTKRNEDLTERRLQVAAALSRQDMSETERRRLRHAFMEEYGVADRTIRRWLALWRQEGATGMANKRREGQASILPEEVVKAAIVLRQEEPQRSISNIITILEEEGVVDRNFLKRSTLQRALHKEGYAACDMRLKTQGGFATRRFQKEHRNALWQTDLKYGPKIDGKVTYLLVIIDDATRLIVHGKFYHDQKTPILEDGLRQAICKYAKPRLLYTDNGPQFISAWLKGVCNRLGIKLLHAKPYACESKGKVENYNKRVEEFLREVKLDKVQDLAALNDKFHIWQEEAYQNKVHSALGVSPRQAWQNDRQILQFATADELREAFLREECRYVDKTGCLSLFGEKYDSGYDFINRRVTVRYDPFDMREVIVRKDDRTVIAKKLNIGEFCDKRPTVGPATVEADNSRLLSALKKQHQRRQKESMGVLSFRDMAGGKNDV